jgi:NAD(P)-dependent dehydrogenase (short-subunit alcohol dehydrogenase family)
MRVDLTNCEALVAGSGPVVEAAIAGLTSNGAHVRRTPPTGDSVPDLLLLASELRAEATPSKRPEIAGLAETWAPRMEVRGGRIIFLLGAIGTLPARRFPEPSASMATLVFRMRGLAMRFGPKVLVNAVGAGAIVDEASTRFVAGAQAMLSHVPTGRPGSIRNLIDAMLFLCDPMNSYMTGQVLTVDGGWSAGYGRNF